MGKGSGAGHLFRKISWRYWKRTESWHGNGLWIKLIKSMCCLYCNFTCLFWLHWREDLAWYPLYVKLVFEENNSGLYLLDRTFCSEFPGMQAEPPLLPCKALNPWTTMRTWTQRHFCFGSNRVLGSSARPAQFDQRICSEISETCLRRNVLQVSRPEILLFQSWVS